MKHLPTVKKKTMLMGLQRLGETAMMTLRLGMSLYTVAIKSRCMEGLIALLQLRSREVVTLSSAGKSIHWSALPSTCYLHRQLMLPLCMGGGLHFMTARCHSWMAMANVRHVGAMFLAAMHDKQLLTANFMPRLSGFDYSVITISKMTVCGMSHGTLMILYLSMSLEAKMRSVAGRILGQLCTALRMTLLRLLYACDT